jgi:hypothetical protein
MQSCALGHFVGAGHHVNINRTGLAQIVGQVQVQAAERDLQPNTKKRAEWRKSGQPCESHLPAAAGPAAALGRGAAADGAARRRRRPSTGRGRARRD